MTEKEIAKAVALVRPETWAEVLTACFGNPAVRRDIVRSARIMEGNRVVTEMNALADQLEVLKENPAHGERIAKLKLRWLQLEKRYQKLKEEAPKNGKAKGS